jgi:hypothetical protein
MPATGDGTSPTLWLASITRTGSDTAAGGPAAAVTLPPVTFGKTLPMQNRVDTVTDGLPPLDRYRIARPRRSPRRAGASGRTGSAADPSHALVRQSLGASAARRLAGYRLREDFAHVVRCAPGGVPPGLRLRGPGGD